MWLPRLPPKVARFYLRCLLLAVRSGDQWSIDVVCRPRELSALLGAASGRRMVLEDGTATGWTAAALAIADADRTVITLDPEVHGERERYLALLDHATRSRLRLVQAGTELGPRALGAQAPSLPVEFFFLDGNHSRHGVVAAFGAWRETLAPGSVVAFTTMAIPSIRT